MNNLILELHEQLIEKEQKINELRDRIDKAIEEIKLELKENKIDNIDGYAKATLIDLLNILKGSE